MFKCFKFNKKQKLYNRFIIKLSRCASCVAKCIPPCDLCAYFRNLQGQTISSWILVYLCVGPNNFSSFKSVWPKTMLVHVIAISLIPIWKKSAISQDWESLKNNSFRVFFFQKICKNCTNISKKALLKPWEKKSE